ncbi:DUF1294 domain-containing protein [Salinibacterium sp. NSLL150]|uniref:DUF1294 domain-containing protein n=1 Tax=unclassified Salinibacterium TaxID=2632331 RepID=UPI0018CE762C|nr:MULTISPECIES: DUF1294 domain-containing protein [unclassified Salinibacterium]MBH0099303.1 DUF1294 domain-containing protein [Salinibacterium sp. NSLL35]MBH0102057.1 DUF1294 domain-containing protein [Salinibacterium sp. NSLL150]MBH0104817.1 DUF1294 domain-containing protein [Salinibacterium sp. NSLL16]MBH0107577.1 DUF1294 domain-containing protein [Salinibacterium sp. NSLL17]
MSSRSARQQGALASWNDERGFGFITVDGPSSANGAGSTGSGNRTGESVFAHISAFPRRDARPAPGERVSFTVETTNDGKTRARSIRYLSASGRPIRARKSRPGTMSYVVLATFAIAISIVTAIGALPWLFAALYLVMSVITYASYATDKKAAQTRQWRVTESALLGLGLFGGWPGAIVAQQRLRHKTQKPMFRQAFWGTVVLNILVFAILTTALREPVIELFRLIVTATAP